MASAIESHGKAYRETEKDVQSHTTSVGSEQGVEMSRDEHQLATLGYKQVFIRSFGLFENWAATFTTMNFVSGMPVLFGFAMYTGGPQAAFANYSMVGGLSTIVALSMAEIAASLPTAGGIYYWAYKLGGIDHGPLLSWLTAWYNWAGWLTIVPGVAQGNTNFFISMLQIIYPESTLIRQGWFGWCISTMNILIGLVPNILSRQAVKWNLRLTAYSVVVLMAFYWIWFPIAAVQRNGFQPKSILTTFYNGINTEVDAEGKTIIQAGDAYCWIIGILFGAWEFYGYDASVHLSEETNGASTVVAKGMWTGCLATWLLSIPMLILILFCMQDFAGIVNGGYANNWAEYLVQLVGRRGAVAILIFTWLDGVLATGVMVLSAQRITYALARDGILPCSKTLSKLTTREKLPVNAAIMVVVLSIAINASVIGSSVAFTALTATGTIGTNISYLIPIVARQTLGRKSFTPAKWNLGVWSLPLSCVAIGYICFLFVVLILPQIYPVTPETLNYAPVMLSGITITALAGWFCPFGLGGRYWYTGPKRTISESEVRLARVKGDYES
ncbi:Hypothetical protein R9X50_00281200 [Acrodontium crateriforme]|uniref:Amino acid or gaba permease n=1 Tax=Acrodontium crateriforme TaxID=150365 RepID=A0AAQ3M1S2_9PEZI|nr:Hypothetical protein R9X50_00281200 [Acrodontium crateriforme]